MDKRIEEAMERIRKEIAMLTSKNPMTKDDVMCLGHLTDAYKDLVTAEEMPKYGENPESSFRDMGRTSYNDGYNDGYSDARMRSPITGRFVSRDGWESNHYEPDMSMARGGGNTGGNSNRSYEQGYSGHSVNDRMIASLEHLMDTAQSEYDKQQIRQEIEAMRNRR